MMTWESGPACLLACLLMVSVLGVLRNTKEKTLEHYYSPCTYPRPIVTIIHALHHLRAPPLRTPTPESNLAS